MKRPLGECKHSILGCFVISWASHVVAEEPLDEIKKIGALYTTQPLMSALFEHKLAEVLPKAKG